MKNSKKQQKIELIAILVFLVLFMATTIDLLSGLSSIGPNVITIMKGVNNDLN